MTVVRDAPDSAVDDTAQPGPSDAAVPARRERYGLELLAVLGVSLGMSGIYALLSLARAEWTVRGGIGASTTTVVSGAQTTYPWLDLLDDLADLMHGLAPPLLALVLLARSPAGAGFGVGFDLRRWRREIPQGVGFLALIGVPGLALVYAAHQAGVNASLDVVNFPDVWYRVPYLLMSAFQNGLAEEIVVVGYMLTRLRQIGWTNQRALLASSLLRGSYHLYQGFGGFAGNFVMGLIFGWWFQRTNRVLPLVIAHFLLDAFSFVGYVYLSAHLSWI
ncbi:MAG TPA: CPBP family intramembrane glutamic endopeptidase [Jatrophihabitantaceae bacterium]|jgi:membrane protease YdiL (CAAX protease family)